MNDTSSQFSFSKSSSIWVWANVACDAILAVALIAITTYVAIDTTNVLLRFGAIFMYGFAGIAAARTIWRLRYRHVLSNVYDVESTGIRFEHVLGGPLVTWDRFSMAEYFPLIPAYRLRVINQSQAIVLFVERSWKAAGSASRRNEIAAQYIRAGLAGQLRRRLLPW